MYAVLVRRALAAQPPREQAVEVGVDGVLSKGVPTPWVPQKSGVERRRSAGMAAHSSQRASARAALMAAVALNGR